jgi:hypothetical protein
MIKLNLTYVRRTQRTSKTGKPFTSLSIKATQYGEQFIGGFGNKSNENWKEGDEVEVLDVKKDPTGKYLNFEMPKLLPNNAVELMALRTEIQKVQAQLRSVIDHLSGKNRLDLTSAGTKIPDFSEVDDGLDQIAEPF